MANSTSTSIFWNRWPFGRQFFYFALLVIDVFLIVAHTTEHLNLENINEKVQAFLASYSPTGFMTAFESAKDHCWVAHGWPTKGDPEGYVTAGCDALPDALLNDDERDLDSMIAGSHANEWNAEQRRQFRLLACEKEHVGCKDYHPAGSDVANKVIRIPFYMMDYIWRGGGGLALAWLLGFVACVMAIKKKSTAIPLGFLFGPFIGSVILLPVLWILEGLTFLLGYALGFIGWLSGLVVVLDVLREWMKFPKEWREDRDRIGGSTQPPAGTT